MHAQYKNKFLPLIYVLLTNKNEVSYTRLVLQSLLLHLLNLRIDHRPEYIIIDFEKAVLLQHFHQILKYTNVTFIFQCIWRISWIINNQLDY